MGVISIQSSLTKLFTVEINDSLQIGVGLSLPTVSPDKIHYAVMLAGSQQGTVCWNTFGMERSNLEPGTKELFQYTVLECWRKGFTAASSHVANKVPPGQITCLRIYQWETETRKSGSLPAPASQTYSCIDGLGQRWLISLRFVLSAFFGTLRVENNWLCLERKTSKHSSQHECAGWDPPRRHGWLVLVLVLLLSSLPSAKPRAAKPRACAVPSWRLRRGRLAGHQQPLSPWPRSSALFLGQRWADNHLSGSTDFIQFGINLAIKSHKEIQ